MKKNNSRISIHANIVLQMMNHNPGMTYNELKNKSRLSDKELGMAIGWLVREDKILFSPEEDKLYLNYYFYF
ncbi:MAG: winged helix-turn-helix domain-containing protein [Parabacteroides sp.]|nr:winged helix-turn-helix domain-containing protein [Parabacteroides sp.]